MITVRGTLNLTDVGAHERVYEGVKANVQVTFSKGQALLDRVSIADKEKAYIESVGSSPNRWVDVIRDEFDNSGDFVLDHIVENLPDDEYERAENYITAYYKDHPMPDGIEVPLSKIEDVL